MTVETFEAAPPQTITPGAIYDLPWPYVSGAVVAWVLHDGDLIRLDDAAFTVSPEASDTSGTLALTAAAAAAWNGGTLFALRLTPLEQGWQGLLGPRERGLERQLDAIVMRVQELSSELDNTVRSVEPIGPLVPQDGRVLVFEGGGITGGPSAGEIEAAAGHAGTAAGAAAAAGVAANSAGNSATAAAGSSAAAGASALVASNAAAAAQAAGTDFSRMVFASDHLENLFLAAHFTDQDDDTINISVSMDGIHFALLNSAVLPGATSFKLQQRDPSITWFEGWWWIFGTGGSAGNHDFVCYRSRDLSAWSKFQIAMQGGPYMSAAVPMPGGVSPASAIWAPEPYIEDGVMKIMLSIRYGADFTNIYGATQQHFKPFIAECLNPGASPPVFGAPVAMDFGPTRPANVLQWRHDNMAAQSPTTPLRHQTYGTDGWGGFELSLIEHLGRAYPGDTVVIVPAAKGSSGFSNSEWTPGGAARTEFAARLNAALAAHPGATIEGMFWHQGEADRSNASYQTQLTAFLTYVRSTWPELATRPVILGEIGQFTTAGTTDVNAVIAAVAATQTNYGTASSLGLTDKGDALHFDTNGYRTLGDRYYTAWRNLRGTIPGTGATRIFIIAGQSNAAGWGPAYHSWFSGKSMIDPSVLKYFSTYYCAIKDSAFRRICIYTAPALTGPWTFSQSLGDTTREMEAPCLVRVRHLDAINSETRRDRWRVYVDHNRTGPTDTNPNSLVGRPFFFETSGNPASDYGAYAPVFFETPTRHGSVINLADYPAEAKQSLVLQAAAGRPPRPNLGKQIELGAGSQWIRPQPDCLYYASVTSGAVDLMLRDGPADRFYLAAMSTLASVGIAVRGEGFSPRPFLVGFGRSNDSVVEMRRRADGQYYPVGTLRRSECRLTRGGANQAITTATVTALDWTTEVFDLGDYFDPVSDRWTPPRGRVDIAAQVALSDALAGDVTRLDIAKNGTVVATAYGRGDGQHTVAVALRGDEATGTDYYQITVNVAGTAGTRTINGNGNLTYFYGIAT